MRGAAVVDLAEEDELPGRGGRDEEGGEDGELHGLVEKVEGLRSSLVLCESADDDELEETRHR